MKKESLKNLCYKAQVEYIRTRGNKALVRFDTETIKFVSRQGLIDMINYNHATENIEAARQIIKSSWKIQYFVKEGRIILRKQDPQKCPLEVGDRIRVHVNMLTHNVVTIIQDIGNAFEVEHRYPSSHEVEFFEKYKCELYDATKDPLSDQYKNL